jgi:hypothetical protein
VGRTNVYYPTQRLRCLTRNDDDDQRDVGLTRSLLAMARVPTKRSATYHHDPERVYETGCVRVGITRDSFSCLPLPRQVTMQEVQEVPKSRRTILHGAVKRCTGWKESNGAQSSQPQSYSLR